MLITVSYVHIYFVSDDEVIQPQNVYTWLCELWLEHWRFDNAYCDGPWSAEDNLTTLNEGSVRMQGFPTAAQCLVYYYTRLLSPQNSTLLCAVAPYDVYF
jgi:hypothetical protein